MTAIVRTLLSMEFIPNTEGVYDLTDINNTITNIEYVFNDIISKFTDKGFYMDDMVLEKATTMSGLMSVMNSNTDKINQYVASLNKALKTNYLLDKEVLSVMAVDLINRDGAATVEVHPLKISVGLHNGQVIDINTTSVVSNLDGDIQTIIHA